MLEELDADTAKRRKWADYMRERGRRLGATPVKGTILICEVCGKGVAKGHVRQRWCAECKPAGVAAYKKAQRATTGTVSVGVQLSCRACGSQFQKEHKRQFYCAPCSEISRLEKFPHQLEGKRKRDADKMRTRRRTIPRWGIHGRMSAGVSASLRDGKNGRSWEALVGYRCEDLMHHLERQFVRGMSWDNRSEWHIDHIQPLASFKFETADDPEFRAAWALSNLRPLWSTENIQKNARRTLLC